MSNQHQTPYSALFKELQPDYDPRHIESYVRLQFSTLGHLDRETLRTEAEIAAACIDAVGAEEAERLAESFGLHPSPQDPPTPVALG